MRDEGVRSPGTCLLPETQKQNHLGAPPAFVPHTRAPTPRRALRGDEADQFRRRNQRADFSRICSPLPVTSGMSRWPASPWTCARHLEGEDLRPVRKHAGKTDVVVSPLLRVVLVRRIPARAQGGAPASICFCDARIASRAQQHGADTPSRGLQVPWRSGVDSHHRVLDLCASPGRKRGAGVVASKSRDGEDATTQEPAEGRRPRPASAVWLPGQRCVALGSATQALMVTNHHAQCSRTQKCRGRRESRAKDSHGFSAPSRGVDESSATFRVPDTHVTQEPGDSNEFRPESRLGPGTCCASRREAPRC